MGAWKRSWVFLKMAFGLMGRNGSLVFIPLALSFLCVALFAVFFQPKAFFIGLDQSVYGALSNLGNQHPRPWTTQSPAISLMATQLLPYVVQFLIFLFTTALICSLLGRLAGGPGRLGQGWALAWQKSPR